MTEVLSQEEINQLLAAINAGHTKPQNFKPEPGSRKIKIYDFKRPDKFSREQIRTISIMYETFARMTTNSLSAQLRSMCHVHVASVDQLTYEEFIRSIPTPTTLAIINMDPLKGSAILEIAPDITFSIIDRICGGIGEGTKSQHELTDIEQNIMEGIIVRILGNLREAWTEVIDLRPRLQQIDTNPQFVQIVPPTMMTVLITLETKVGDVEGMINFCIPYSTVEPIMGKFFPAFWYGSVIHPSGKIEPEDVPVIITAEVLRRDYSIKEIREWEIGTELLPSRPLSPDHCFLWFGDRRVWQCEILPDNKRFAKCVKIIGVTDKPFEMEGKKMEQSKVNPLVDDALSNVGLTISVEIGTTVKTVKEVRGMGEGTIVELDKLAGELVDVKANGILIAYGEVVVIDENFGVRITELIAPTDSSAKPSGQSSDKSTDESSQVKVG
ncbi:MAG: flagellar motor switch protein FliM [Treponema sp.]|jgi:flagellar motor switch protein FliM|nr:flagellar motor switch protein FliM [Treponema sp.]